LWLGGPDFAVEIVSPDDASRDKLDFYARVGVRELLVIDRDASALELYRLQGRRMISVGRSIAGDTTTTLQSEVIPLSFRLIEGGARPLIEVHPRRERRAGRSNYVSDLIQRGGC